MAEGPGRRGTGRTRTAVLPGARAAARGRAASILPKAKDWLVARLHEEAELGRPALWLPVAFGAGAAVYFAADREPQLWAAVLAFAAAVALTCAARRRFFALGLALAAAALAGGFLAAKLATVRAEAPILARAMRAEVVGRVVRVEPREGGRRRVTLAVERFGDLEDEALPARARVTLGPKPGFTAGDRIALTAYWRPPQGPVRPGGYDFARVAFYDRIGATAFAPSNVSALGPAPDQGFRALASAALERLRERLTTRITTAVGGAEGTVAAALVTGVQGPIPQGVEDDLRAAGLAHILSISGLHMALIAGTVFWLVRAALALVPALALRWPVKQVAAAAALAAATFYLALSGAEVATQRSYVMIAVAFVAVLFGRPALAPRNFAVAGLLVLALTPEALLGPSFQMSFAAVAGLVAWFETRRDRPAAPVPETRAGRAWRWLAGAAALAVMTTLIAGLATAPFAAYHFHRATPYALAGNALATPLLSLVVMPSVVGGLMAAPFGLDGPWWSLMGWGIRAVLAIARAIASWPGAERFMPAFGETALVLFAAGIAWLCLWRTAIRWAAAPVLGLALILAAFPSRPDVVIDASGAALAARGPTGALTIVGKGSSFTEKVWLAAEGEPKGAAATARCDALGCVAPLAGGGVVALVRDARAFEEDCRIAALVVTRLRAPQECRATAAVVDRDTLNATGALSLERRGGEFIGVPALDPAADRPWMRRRPGVFPPEEALSLRFAPSPPETAPDAADARPVDPTDDTDASGADPE